MDMIPSPESSQIEEFGYDPENRMLAIRFKSSGAVYHYMGVPAAIFEGMKAAESKGRYFGQNIKRGPFPYQRQEGV